MTTPTATRHKIPPPCCAPGRVTTQPDGTLSGDLNKDWTCQRTAIICTLASWAVEIDAGRDRADKLRDPRRQANLRMWADDQETRMGRLAEAFHAGDIERAVSCSGLGRPVKPQPNS